MANAAFYASRKTTSLFQHECVLRIEAWYSTLMYYAAQSLSKECRSQTANKNEQRYLPCPCRPRVTKSKIFIIMFSLLRIPKTSNLYCMSVCGTKITDQPGHAVSHRIIETYVTSNHAPRRRMSKTSSESHCPPSRAALAIRRPAHDYVVSPARVNHY